MSLGKRKHEQQEAWVATTDLPKSPGHPFYQKLNQLLAEAGFDAWLEALCRPYYADRRAAVDPARRLLPHDLGRLLRGHRLATGHRLAVQRQPLAGRVPGRAAHEDTPDHSSLTRMHQRLAAGSA